MALINCPECSKEISDRALACPGCGHTFKGAKKSCLSIKPRFIELLGKAIKQNRFLEARFFGGLSLAVLCAALAVAGVSIAVYLEGFGGFFALLSQ